MFPPSPLETRSHAGCAPQDEAGARLSLSRDLTLRSLASKAQPGVSKGEVAIHRTSYTSSFTAFFSRAPFAIAMILFSHAVVGCAVSKRITVRK